MVPQKRHPFGKLATYVRGIQTENGSWIEDMCEVESIFANCFKAIFTSSFPSLSNIEAITDLIPTTITPQLNVRLLAPYREEEIEIAIRQMFPTKAPGPDGFPTLFYQNYWSIVGPKTVDICLKVLNDNVDITQLNNTYIALIPKIKKSKVSH